MSSKERILRTDLKSIVDEVTTLRNAYVRLQSYSANQQQSLLSEQNKSLKLQARLRFALNTFLALKQRFKVAWDRVKTENETLTETVKDLQRKCDQLKTVRSDQSHQDPNQCVSRLVEEPTQLPHLEFDGKNENCKINCGGNTVEKVQKSTVKVGTDQSSVQRGKRRRKKKTSLNDYHPVTSASRVGDANRRRNCSYFKWPSLDVTISGGKIGRNGVSNDDGVGTSIGADDDTTEMDVDDDANDDVDDGGNGTANDCAASNDDNKGIKSLNRKRKLYSDDKDDLVDI